jgi:hypothetical protein
VTASSREVVEGLGDEMVAVFILLLVIISPA